ncbi:C-X-C motif chemokine 13 [Monodelphis domestica]|uniref:Interleukin-8 n=1 Tax=Monodelphis domestica TaxID=13616 RepID=A0A5F8GSS6_MONDO|nr:C-X-C motif chemokine 13 [Monodelphis domestica]
MKFTAISVVLVLLVIKNSSVQGILETNDANHKCKCLKTFGGALLLQYIKTIYISPPSGGCRNTEFIVTLKNGDKICVDPKCKWLSQVLRTLRRKKATTSNTNVQRQRQDSK